MSLFDCRFLPSPSPNHSYSDNQQCSSDCFDQNEVSNGHTDSINDSTASCYVREIAASPLSSPSPSPSPSPCNIARSPGKRIERALYKGPDVFGKVLGPTADESILVGLQALMDMAGTLEFSTATIEPSICEQSPVECTNFCSSRDSRESRDASAAAVSQSSASCQCSSYKCHERSTSSSPAICTDDYTQEIVTEIRQKPCQYIITQENIATVTPKRNKCQQSQTRVLPTSMTSYNQETMEPSGKRRMNVMPCTNIPPQRLPPPRSALRPLKPSSPPLRKQPSPPTTTSTPVQPPCSQYYHQMTTISVMENAPQEPPTCIPCEPCGFRSREPERIFSREDVSASIQTLPMPCPTLCDAYLETDTVTSVERNSIACNCNFCVPISAGVSSPPSRAPTVPRINTSVQYSDEEKEKPSTISVCCGPRNVVELKHTPLSRNKSCACSLIAKGIRVADAACSCLKVNTSCQYYKSELQQLESRSTQCEKKSNRNISCTQICSESGDCQPHRKKSVKILSGPYEFRDFSETRYCMEPKKTLSKNLLPLLDCSDEISKYCFDKPARVCLEMGDSYVPPPMEIRYAITKITKFNDFSTFEVMKSTSKKPKCMPKAVEGVFVLKKEENCT